MMFVFRSEVAPDIMMFGDVAKRLLEIIGKEAGARGVITVEQMPEAIARLRAAIAEDRARHKPQGEGEETGPEGPRITLAQRAIPFVEQLELSLARGKPVMWGV